MTNSMANDGIQQRHFQGFIFDLDGTLLDTLPDIVVVINKALVREGFPSRTQEDILQLIGDGVQTLALKSVPKTASPEEAQKVFQHFKNLYARFGLDLTKQYAGMAETLEELKRRGKKVGIMSNKFEGGVKSVVQKFFPHLIDVAHGESPSIRRKPQPDGLLACAKEMQLSPKDCVYFGDSETDMLAAHNAGMFAVGVTWGYQPLEKLNAGKPDALINQPKEILMFC